MKKRSQIMAKLNPEVISLKGEPIFKEGQSSSAISPGYLIEFGGSKDLQPQSTAKENCRRAFALENDLLGKGIEDDYGTDERVRYGSFHAGQEVYAKIPASAAAIVKGDALEATGDGTLRKLTTGGAVIAYSLESKDNSSGTTETFIKVEIA